MAHQATFGSGASWGERIAVTQAELLTLIAKGRPLAECLDAITACVSRLQPGTRACILIASEARDRLEKIHAADVPSSLGAALGGARVAELAIGAGGRAAPGGESITCTDIAHDERWAPEWRAVWVSHGILACHCEPVTGPGHHWAGAMMVCFGEAREPSPQELLIARFAAGIAALALEQAHTRESLRASEEFGRRVLGSSADCIKLLELDGSLESISEGGCRALGFDATYPPPIGASWPSMFEPEGRSAARAAVQQACRGEVARFEAHLKTRAGAIRCWDSVLTPITGANEQPEKILALSRDITDRRAAEAALRAEETRRSFLLALGDRSRSLADPELIVATATRMLGEYLGATRVSYAEIDETKDRAVAIADWTDGTAAHLPSEMRMSDFGTKLISRLRSGGTLRVDDIALDPHTVDSVPALEGITARAMVSVPLFKDARFVVNLNVHQGHPRAWTDMEVELIETVAERTWEAVERARTQAIMRDSEARYRQIVEGADDFAIITLDEAGIITAWNSGAEHMVGYAREEAIGQPGTILFTPEDCAAGVPRVEMERALANERAVNERWHLRKDGTRFWGSGLMMRLDGERSGFLKMFRDRTAEHEAEAALHELNATLEARVEERTAERDRAWRLSRDLLVVVDQDGSLLAVNAAWTTLLGWQADELVGQTFAGFTHPDDLPATLAALDSILDEPLTTPYEFRFRHKDGSYRWFAWTAAFEQGRVYANGRHTTPEHEQAEALAQAEEALRQSQKMEAMGNLTGGVAHDFNNLLTPIVGALDMLQRKGLGGEREQRLIAGAALSAERAKTLVQRLLAFARRQPLQPTAVDVAKLVAGMADLIGSTAGPQIKVIVEAPDGLPPAKADPNQLEMALLNLSVNARDAMVDGGTLRITAREEHVGAEHPVKLRPGRFIRLSVADTGIGMDQATLARAIEPFFSTKGVGKGTGLGLSMAHGLASQLGGALTIQSRPGIGTNVELWLPLSDAAAQTGEAGNETAPAIAAMGTALLVDDEELVRISTADMLSDLGYRVLEAASAEEALQLIRGGLRADLLVTDHLMPGMNGTDLARLVRSEHPGVQILIVSGYAESEGIAPDLPRLAKPFRSGELAASLAALAAPPAH